jgi:uracil-DNA glycosylase
MQLFEYAVLEQDAEMDHAKSNGRIAGGNMVDFENFDPGPPQAFARHFAAVPSYVEFKEAFWLDWGPIFYRGRLDGTAKVLCIASDPGATERIALRTLVGDAGQRVQGFLNKLGLVQSYACLNAYAYALIPGESEDGDDLLLRPEHLTWRNTLFDMAKTPALQAVVAFGAQARNAVSNWPGKDGIPVYNLPHPSSRDPNVLAQKWREAVVKLRTVVTPDEGGDPTGANYGETLAEEDYAPIPRRDLPFGVPEFMGDDRWLRGGSPPQYASVTRPRPDDRHTLIWKAPIKS